jgi:hypothetical protein
MRLRRSFARHGIRRIRTSSVFKGALSGSEDFPARSFGDNELIASDINRALVPPPHDSGGVPDEVEDAPTEREGALGRGARRARMSGIFLRVGHAPTETALPGCPSCALIELCVAPPTQSFKRLWRTSGGCISQSRSAPTFGRCDRRNGRRSPHLSAARRSPRHRWQRPRAARPRGPSSGRTVGEASAPGSARPPRSSRPRSAAPRWARPLRSGSPSRRSRP